ncbi:MAG TPA: hypothetical protein VFV67_24420 [Actinophytocola sp.]|uniref:hypothetical protein n=1 Tax=Actinophytocola sp. TaxID=1872138 RepID=UPI002DBF65D2|nr:hypothetical protein [Actinophytocola sp.]HEU5473802.1 hypothetical protein [Actinophytocola sp.]
MRSRSLLAAVVLAAGLVTATAPAAVAQSPAACDPVDPAACLLPFPNDYFTVADSGTATGIRVDLKREAMPRNVLGSAVDPREWNRNDGFSPGAMLLTHVPGLDPVRSGLPAVTDIGASLAPDAPIVLINTRTGQRHPYWAELDANATDPARQVLIIRPARNLDETTRYAVALRNLRDPAGNPVPPNPVYATLTQPDPPPDPALHRRWQYAQRALTGLRAAGTDLTGLYLAWDFTVASGRNLTERMLHMRDEAFAQLGNRAPALTIDSVTDFPVEQDPSIARRVTGTVIVPSYLNTPLGLPGSRLRYDSDGLPGRLPLNVQLARFICNIPRSAAGTAPARPLIYGHGLLGDPSEIDSGGLKAYMAATNTMFCATPWIGMAQEDIPNVVVSLADASQFPSIPDRSQQGFLNFLFLGRALTHPAGLAARSAFRDAAGRPLHVTGPGSLVYLGNSQGGIMGGALTAIAQDFTLSVLGVPAANYSLLLNRSVDFDQFRTVFDPAYPDRLDQQLLFALFQMLWDRGEANGYAHHIAGNPLPGTPGHRVLMIEAFGDHQVANIGTEVQARTMGIPHRAPALAPGRSPDVTPFWDIPAIPAYPHAGSALVMVDSGTPAPPPTNLPNRAGSDPHSHPRNSPAVLAMTAHFLATGQVIDTCGGQPCTAPGG